MKNKRLLALIMCVSCASMLMPAQGETLFQNDQYQSLVGDPRARQVGQSVTVLIIEQASAATSADAESNKGFDVAGSIEGNDAGNRNSGRIGFDNGFQGGGTVSRTGRLVASVSVTIKEVLPNGEFWIEGEQLIHFNEEQQHIKVAGRVRRDDISADNTIISTRIADSSIDYSGEGLLGASQRPGVVTRFFNWLF